MEEVEAVAARSEESLLVIPCVGEVDSSLSREASLGASCVCF